MYWSGLERRKSIGGEEARLGDLANVDLEEEFNDEIYSHNT